MHIHNIFPVLALKWMNFGHRIFVCLLVFAIEKIEIYKKYFLKVSYNLQHRSKNDWVMFILGFKFFCIFVLKNLKFQKKIYSLKATLELGSVGSWQISRL